jgi:glyoxylase I family protein
MIRGVHHVAVHVRDIERMSRFYQEAFGFKVVGGELGWSKNGLIDEIIDVRGSSSRNVMLWTGNCYLELFQFLSHQPDKCTLTQPYDFGYTHLCLDVTHVDEECARLKGLGMTFDRPHGEGYPVDVGFVKTIYGRDPEGNIVEIQETRPHCVFPLKAQTGS